MHREYKEDRDNIPELKEFFFSIAYGEREREAVNRLKLQLEL